MACCETAHTTHTEDKMFKNDKEEILSFSVPQMNTSYLSTKNPQATAAQREAFTWLRENDLESMYKSPKALLSAIRGDIAGLAMQVYVNAAEELAPWVCKYYLWTFALDDFLDAEDNFYSPEKTTALFIELNLAIMWSFPDNSELRHNLIAILGTETAELDVTLNYVDNKLALARLDPGTIYASQLTEEEPLLRGFLLLWKEMAMSSPPEFMLRWGIAFQGYVIANMQEVKNRSSNSVPSLDDYILMRRGASGTYVCVMIYELSDQAFVPDEIFYGREFQDMHLAFADVIAWMNDIFSFQKEALLGEVHNMVCIIKRERRCSYQEAGAIAFQMLLKRIADLEDAAKILMEVTPKEHLEAIEAYIKGAHNWLSGGYDWHANSVRYKVKSVK